MNGGASGLDAVVSEVTRMTAPEVLGFYTHFEATEIFALLDGQKTPFNVFSILVAEERFEEPTLAPWNQVAYFGWPRWRERPWLVSAGEKCANMRLCRSFLIPDHQCIRRARVVVQIVASQIDGAFSRSPRNLSLTQVFPCSISITSAQATLARSKRSRSTSRTCAISLRTGAIWFTADRSRCLTSCAPPKR
jgi:hypothetical protein